jgi:hypothetical protein
MGQEIRDQQFRLQIPGEVALGLLAKLAVVPLPHRSTRRLGAV